jgi:hypothetical protein
MSNLRFLFTLSCVIDHALEVDDHDGLVSDHPGVVSRGNVEDVTSFRDLLGVPSSIRVVIVPEI